MRKLIVLVFYLFAAKLVFAAEVGLDDAKSFAFRWRGKNVSAARTHKSAAGESRFHVVSFEGGGWAAVGVDDEESPVIAFSDNGEELVEDEKNPVWFLVKRDAEWRAKDRSSRRSRGLRSSRGKHKGWENAKVKGGSKKVEGMGGVKTASLKTAVSEGALEDVRVAPLLKSTWNQTTANNYSNGPLCYNYYTPNNYPCGCVATMMAQMLRYFEWPKTSVEAKTFPCYVGTTIPDEIPESDIVDKTMMGGIYDWEKMTLKPSLSTSLASRQEIGKLCYDCGVSANMMWSEEGSGAFLANARQAFIDTWGYSSASVVLWGDTSKGRRKYNFDELKKIVVTNCEAALPVGYGISGTSGGHAVVIDGYGYSGDSFFVHINPGWGGSSNAWYSPPDLSMGGYSFSSSDELIYNVFTEGKGALITGKVMDQYGRAVDKATIKAFQINKLYNRVTTNLLYTAISSSDGRYSLKTGTESAINNLYVVVSKNGFSIDKETNVLKSRSMVGSHKVSGGYSQNNYSLGNIADLDFVLKQLPPPKVLFR